MTSSFTPHLTPDERILWEGQPSARLFVFRAYDAFLIPFAAVFAVISVGVLILGVATDLVFLGVGLIFGIVTLYMGLGRFFVSQARHKGTRYALTGQRALILEGSKTSKGMALTHDLPISQRHDRATFGRPVPAFFNLSSAAAIVGGDADFTFCGLDDATAVHGTAARIKRGGLA